MDLELRLQGTARASDSGGPLKDCYGLGSSQTQRPPGCAMQILSINFLSLSSFLLTSKLLPSRRGLPFYCACCSLQSLLNWNHSSILSRSPDLDQDPGARCWKTQSLPCRSSPTLKKTVLGAGRRYMIRCTAQTGVSTNRGRRSSPRICSHLATLHTNLFPDCCFWNEQLAQDLCLDTPCS
jgi:hypothetical protein